ncbi:MAG TPA: hypothetical protein VHR47_01825, partial [Bacillota bacterium]|nr:hypothetical protein [Bacillota bacterium]
MKNKLTILFLIFVVATSLLGCGGGGGRGGIPISNTPTIAPTPPYPINEPSAKELSRDVNVTISDFNGKHIYTLNTPVLTSKPEGDSTASLTQYGYSITSVSASSPSKSLTITQSNLFKKNQYINPRYSGQSSFDLIVREKENILLSKRMHQVDKSTKFLADRPAVIAKDTPWNGVNITLTGKTIDTTCKRVSNHAYFFVDNRDINKMEPYMDGYATAFDSIYGTDRDHFGTESDVDNNGKIIIIFSEALESEPGLLGYFYAGDKYPSSAISDSNNGDIIYLTTNQSSGYQGENM